MNSKPVVFKGSSQNDLKSFNKSARREAGFQLFNLQSGEDPDDWRPMQDIGTGVFEIRIHEKSEFRIIYIAKFSEAVYVLHAFQKKTQKTRKHDIGLARTRYNELIRKRKRR